MFQKERQEQILDYINEHKKVYTKELSQKFNISEVTIRDDMNVLAQEGLIIKVHGGALSLSGRKDFEIPFRSREQLNTDRKKCIAEAAEKIIAENDVVILDSGTTTLEIARLILERHLTVITNDIKIAMTLCHAPNITLVMTGGTTRPSIYTLSGMEAVSCLQRLNADVLFIGGDAVDAQYGITDRSIQEVAAKRAMIEASGKVVAVADSSKLGKRVFAKVCDTSEIDTLITDSISESDFQAYTAAGIEVIAAVGKKPA